ncbi:MAG: oligonucleotide/oligosaccharide-binding fold domain-containing protein, partial [Planctomycetota bacterium]
MASAILQAKTLRLGPLETLPLIDPPHSDMIRDGYRTLVEIGALDQRRELTPIGRQLARLPLDPRLGRMLIAARDEGCLREMLIVAAALEVQDPRERPFDRREAADLAHRVFHDGRSDFIALLKLWHHFQQRKGATTRGQLRKECERSFLSYNRLRQWQDTERQLRQLVRDEEPANQDLVAVDPERYRSDKKFYQAFHQSMLTGLLSGVAWRSDGVEYTGPNQLKLNLWPGCGPFQAKPNWIMAAEFVETNRRYARLVATIEPRWIEQVGRHLLEYSYDQPQWYRRAG